MLKTCIVPLKKHAWSTGTEFHRCFNWCICVPMIFMFRGALPPGVLSPLVPIQTLTNYVSKQPILLTTYYFFFAQDILLTTLVPFQNNHSYWRRTSAFYGVSSKIITVTDVQPQLWFHYFIAVDLQCYNYLCGTKSLFVYSLGRNQKAQDHPAVPSLSSSLVSSACVITTSQGWTRRDQITRGVTPPLCSPIFLTTCFIWGPPN